MLSLLGSLQNNIIKHIINSYKVKPSIKKNLARELQKKVTEHLWGASKEVASAPHLKRNNTGKNFKLFSPLLQNRSVPYKRGAESLNQQ